MYFPNLLQFSYLLALFVPALATPVPIEAPIPFDDKESWSIGWSDDFKGESGVKFNSDKWGYQTPAKNENDEIQRYTDLADNARLTGQGTGVILPWKQQDGSWTSARLYSNDAFVCEDGKMMTIRAEIKLGEAAADKQKGIWPAFWLLGDQFRTGGRWPDVGEIDIMENKNGEPTNFGTAHWEDKGEKNSGTTKAFQRSPGLYHAYSITINREWENWEQQSISWELDGIRYHEITGKDIGNEDKWKVLAHTKQFIILNVAIGGIFSGPVNENTATGEDVGMEIKNIAVYKRK